jgi:N-acetylmuramoyl-L-alanine amidase
LCAAISATLVALLAAGAAPSTATAAACVPSSFGIALDIGHDRAHPGAIGASGTPEFEYNQLLGRAAVAALRNAGFATAFLIEERGTPLGIEERTRIAAERHAALLLSLHHDSVQPRYLSERTVAGRPQRFSDLFHGFSIFVSGRNAHAKQSERFADLLAQALLTRGLTPSLHHAQAIPGENRPLLNARLGVYRFDDLVILAGASMPAALLESGVIVNRAEEQAIRQGSYHEAVVAAVVQAVGDFCRRGPGGR